MVSEAEQLFYSELYELCDTKSTEKTNDILLNTVFKKRTDKNTVFKIEMNKDK